MRLPLAACVVVLVMGCSAQDDDGVTPTPALNQSTPMDPSPFEVTGADTVQAQDYQRSLVNRVSRLPQFTGSALRESGTHIRLFGVGARPSAVIDALGPVPDGLQVTWIRVQYTDDVLATSADAFFARVRGAVGTEFDARNGLVLEVNRLVTPNLATVREQVAELTDIPTVVSFGKPGVPLNYVPSP